MKLLSFSLLLRSLFCCWFSLSPTLSSSILGNETDRLALLAFKSKITQDPFNVMSSWNDSYHFCDWEGVTCSSRYHQRVQSIGLFCKGLSGQISPQIGNLSFLRALSLENNNFHGIVPRDISQLFRLRHLILNDNSLSGEILDNISVCSNLISLELSHNNFVGKLPMELGHLSELVDLSLAYNTFTGNIPPSFGNLTHLWSLQIRDNAISGSIPSSLNQLKSLKVLDFASNNISGMFLFNISSLKVISIANNSVEGKLPLDIGLLLPNLKKLYLGANKFSGPIPTSLYNASKLQLVDLVANQFNGQVHLSVGNLIGLETLSLGYNHLGSGKPGDLDFITSLTNCSNLQFFSIRFNQFGGMLPISIANLSNQLREMLISRNQISGNIPNVFENFQNLIKLDISSNLLTGSIPMGIGKLQNLQFLDLNSNQLSGHIPSSIRNISHLFLLDLSSNSLGGSIASGLHSQSLQYFYASYNNFTGSIPPEIGLCFSLLHFWVGCNSFTGHIPSKLGNLKNVVSLDLSENKLSGEIPSTLGSCISLQAINFQANFLSGSIPSFLGSFQDLQVLYLSSNNLTGEIPKVLGMLSLLQSLNLSSNNLEGEVPIEGIFQNTSAFWISRNKMICGGIPELGLPNCHGLKSKKKTTGIAWKVTLGVLILSLMVMVVFFFFICWRKKHAPKSPSDQLPGNLRRISYNDLHKATDGFSSENLIGIGSYGSVYKGILHQDGSLVAVKVLNLMERGASKSFLTECDTLKAIRHRNLLKIITVCSSVDFSGFDFKALIFVFMPNGSLESWLHPVSDELNIVTSLDIRKRLNITIDVASALDYLHNQCGTPIIHCDLKPSNVLLDDDFTACVGDFGLAKYYSEVKSTNESQQNSTYSFSIRGTIGYIPPEYGTGGKASPEGDVYSYGILLLEI